MDANEPGKGRSETLRRLLGRALRVLGSLKLAVALLIVLAATIAVATVLEAKHGRAYSQWYVYHSGWFINLLALLGVNIFSAAASRWPWKRHQTGFVITHAGLLVLLAGSLRTFHKGVEGQVTLRVGETATKMHIPNQSQITATWTGRTDEPPYEFSFEHGPVDWREGRTLSLGEIDGIGARVLRYYQHARAVEEWLPDETGQGGPAVKIRVEGPDSEPVEHVLADDDYGDEAFAGPVRIQLRRATGDAMLRDFLAPPTDNLGKKGLLLAYFENHAERIPVEENLGKKVPLADTGAAVQIVQYMPDATGDAHGNFRSRGVDPKNPLLELRVWLPRLKDPLRQWAFANSSLLNLDFVYGRVCPVKFEYHHPAITQPPAIDLMQTRDGKLYARHFANNQLVSHGVMKVGESIQLSDQSRMSLVEHIVHAREHVAFKPVLVEASSEEKPEAAAEIAVSAGGRTQTVWLQRNHSEHGTRTLTTPDGALQVSFGYAEAPLGFSLNLVNFQRERNPGGIGNASFASLVRVVEAGQEEEREIWMNHPLTRNGLTFYQSGFNEGAQGAESSTFSVACDPGRAIKYAGSLMICLGIATMFYMKAYFFKNASRPAGKWARLFQRWRTAPDRNLETDAETAELPQRVSV
jgi:hypothetical protein